VVKLGGKRYLYARRIDIDHKPSRAIAKEIGDKLRGVLKPEPEQPESLKTQIEQLREQRSAHRQSLPVPSIGRNLGALSRNLVVEPQMGRRPWTSR
jgi:hypothetical protein